MNVLVINGSPRGKRSNTYRITTAFLEGMKAASGDSISIQEIDVSAAHIEHCRGCFCCWTATPGKCAIHDDMENILPKILEADTIVWSFPLYYFGMPSKVKALLDRSLPLNLPFIEKGPDGRATHPRRYDGKPADQVLISTCGFYSTEHNYDALIKQFDIVSDGQYTKILCPEGELFSQPPLKNRTDEYLSYVRQAGKEYAKDKRFSKETEEKLSELLYAPDAFTAMANASWEIADETIPQTEAEKHRLAAERFTRQMAATYNPSSFDGIERIFEIYYTDVEAGYQLVMGKDRCEVRTKDFAPYTTRVETPLTVWQGIADGIYNGAQAMMEGKYKTLGDLKLLMSWGHYFGQEQEELKPAAKNAAKKTNMTLMLIPWLVIWLLLTINPTIGGIAGICTAAAMSLASLKWSLTIYDSISCLCVSVCSLLALLGFHMQLVVPLSYLCFGLMWLLSCFTPLPLSAHYSKEDYNGDEALDNPLFIKTNLILTACWGVLYIITPIWTFFIMGSSIAHFTGLINSVCPAALGIFTAWFQKWYPAKVAKG